MVGTLLNILHFGSFFRLQHSAHFPGSPEYREPDTYVGMHRIALHIHSKQYTNF